MKFIKYFSDKSKSFDYVACDDCYEYIKKIPENCVDVVLTSPPYNNARETELKNGARYYNDYIDNISTEKYIANIVKLFKELDRVLKKNGVILFNFNYSQNSLKTSSLVYLLVAALISETEFTVADTIIWKKSNYWPNVMSPNKLSRCWEYVFVFCRKCEYKTFNVNKPISSKRSNGQNNYCNIENFVQAKNNDGPNKLNHCCFSTDLVCKLLSLYSKEGDIVLDPFVGMGTTIYGALKLNRRFIGIEIDKEQVKFIINKIQNKNLKINIKNK